MYYNPYEDYMRNSLNYNTNPMMKGSTNNQPARAFFRSRETIFLLLEVFALAAVEIFCSLVNVSYLSFP